MEKRDLLRAIAALEDAEQLIKQLKRPPALRKIRDVKDILLFSTYLSEFEVIDGLSQHPDGIPFDQWKKRLMI